MSNFWSNGFGIKISSFSNLYSQNALHYGEENALLSIPNFHINPYYFNIIVDLGAIFILMFMYYVLFVAHSSLSCMFGSTKKQKIIFAAGLASLIGISISAVFESNLFEPRVLIMYWAMLGILRSQRIVKFGVLD